MFQSIRIILVLPVAPLPFGGASARSFYVFIKQLNKTIHRVTIFCVCRKEEEISQLASFYRSDNYDIRCYLPDTQKRLTNKLISFIFPYSRQFSREMRDELEKEISKGCDVLHLETTWSGWLGLNNIDKAAINIRCLFSLDNSFALATDLKSKLLKSISYRAESKMLKSYRKILALSDELAQNIRKINPQAKVWVVPSTLDLSLYPFQENKAVKLEPIIGLIGSFNWTPSYLATERLLTRLWPAIKLRLPRAKLQIVGRSAKTSLAKFVGLPDVEFHQDVPDILPYFHNLDVMVYAPAFGSGMKVKIMESFALGLPVVTNANGVEGLPAVDGVHAGICEDDQGLVDRTVELIENADIYQQRRLQARQLLETHCSPEVVMEKLELVYQEICKISE